MYEIWLVLNIVYEIALTIWPALLVALGVWLALLWAAGSRLGRRTLVWSLALGGLVVLVAGLALPALTQSALGDMNYWLDWALLAGLALAWGAVAAAVAFPLLSLMHRTD